MIQSFRSLFLLVALVATSSGWAGCAASSDDDDDDDDDIGGEGEGEGEGECNPLICNDEGQACCGTGEDGQGPAACIQTNTSFPNCGACGEGCETTQANLCVAGECACGGGDACGGGADDLCCPGAGGCIDTTSNPEACGACNNNCIAPDTTEKESDRCTDGACACGDSGEACTGRLESTCCPDEDGGATCHNVKFDLDNCGGCALADRFDDDGFPDSRYACLPELSNICTNGRCVCGIPTDLGIDPFPCLGGRASTCCAPANPDESDLALCADLDTSELHCGGCNNPCAKNETCANGVCVD